MEPSPSRAHAAWTLLIAHILSRKTTKELQATWQTAPGGGPGWRPLEVASKGFSLVLDALDLAGIEEQLIFSMTITRPSVTPLCLARFEPASACGR